ncbi:MAG: hypothetical protein GY771_11520 [bacterium]|nr:hypothetical protein [bacterium]
MMHSDDVDRGTIHFIKILNLGADYDASADKRIIKFYLVRKLSHYLQVLHYDGDHVFEAENLDSGKVNRVPI